MALDPLIIAVFGPPPANIDLAENEISKNNAAVAILLVIATIAVILRFIARIVQRNPLKADDWTIILALLFVGGTTGLSIAGGTFGAGKHIWAVTLPGLTEIFKLLYTYTFIYAGACSATKTSILFFYQRIFTTWWSDLYLRLSILLCFFLSLSYPIIIWVTMGNCCRPVSFYWNQFSGAKGECIDVKTFFLALGIINMLNDVIILAVPIPQILKLQMSNRKKAAVCGIMLLGSFVCVASVVRIYYLSEFSKAIDVTWLMGPVFIWSTIEPSIAIVSACLPHLAPLAVLLRSKLSSSFGSKRSGPEFSNAPWRSRSGAGQGSQKGFAYGGPRFNFGGDGVSKLGEADDEIGLTNHVTAGSGPRKAHSIESGSEDNVHDHTIVVQSSFVQSTSKLK